MATKNSLNLNVTKDQELNLKNHVLRFFKNSQVRIFQKTAYMWAAYMSGSRNSFVSIIFVLQFLQNRKAKLYRIAIKNVISGTFFNKKLLKKANVKNSPCLLIDQAF